MSNLPEHYTESGDDWTHYSTQMDDETVEILLNLSAADEAPMAEMPLLVRVRVSPREGMEAEAASPKGTESYEAIEFDLMNNLADELEALPVAYIHSENWMEAVLHAPADAPVSEVVASIMEKHQLFDSDVEFISDPAWNYFQDELFPDEDTLLYILDRDNVAELLAAGDDVEQPRAVAHAVVFASADDRAAFVKEAEGLGFELLDATEELVHEGDDEEEGEGTGGAPKAETPGAGEGEILYGALLVREDAVTLEHIHHVTKTLRTLALRFEGEYDGWETDLIGDEELPEA